MPTVHKSVLLPYSATQMYALVVDVDAYPQFLPWCTGVSIQQRDALGLIATLQINYHSVKQKFTTRNVHVVNERIELHLQDGPFSELDGYWQFIPLRADACKVEFRLHYAFSNTLFAKLVGPVFDHIANNLIESFTRRAQTLYVKTAVDPIQPSVQ